MSNLAAAPNTESSSAPGGRRLPVWAIAGIVGVLAAVGGGALSTALVKNQATPDTAAEVAPTDTPAPKRTTPVARAAKPAPERAAVCSNCGTVEKVVAIKQKGEGTGVGAVAGGVVGGVLGNQVGGGNGKKAMTVIGAVGGGFAGHEIEKQARATTVYKVSVRMEDGSLRTVTQSSAPAVGSRIKL